MKFKWHMKSKMSNTGGMVNYDTDMLWTFNGTI